MSRQDHPSLRGASLTKTTEFGVQPLLACGHYGSPVPQTAVSVWGVPDEALFCNSCSTMRQMDLRLQVNLMRGLMAE